MRRALWLLLGFAAFLFAESSGFAVDFGGRKMPVRTFSLLVAESFCGKASCAGIPEDSLLLMVRDGRADSASVFRVNRHAAVEILHLDFSRRNFRRDDFDSSRSLLRQYAERDDSRPLSREFVRLDGALNLYDSLQSDSYWNRISVAESEVSPGEARRISAESRYLKVNLPFASWILACASLAFALFSLWLGGGAGKFCFGAGACLQAILSVSILGTFLWRGIVAARIPLVSLYEMILALVLGSSLLNVGIAARRKSRGIFSALACVNVAFFWLLRTALSSGDPFGKVSPMLDSPFWLSLHVFTIASGFCLLAVSSLLAHGCLFLRFRGKACGESLERLSLATLRAGFGLSAFGTLFGGFWADVAWGRFWGFDPKENGALLVLLWVLIIFHLKAGKLARRKTLEILQALLAVVLAFCLFGVNLLGVGLHSYGYSPGVFAGFAGFVAVDSLLVFCLALRRDKR